MIIFQYNFQINVINNNVEWSVYPLFSQYFNCKVAVATYHNLTRRDLKVRLTHCIEHLDAMLHLLSVKYGCYVSRPAQHNCC